VNTTAKVKVLTDSTADLPPSLAKEYNLIILPMVTTFAGVAYRDGVDLTPAQFYALLTKSSELPHTSQHSPSFLLEAYKAALADGSEAIAIHLSSGMSGTVAAANQAWQVLSPEERKRLVVIDSLNASVGQGLLSLKAAEMAIAGEPLSVIADEVLKLREELNSVFMVDTLTYLLKGGRINRMQAVMGSLLDIKPVLHVNSEGRIDQLEKIRGRKAALRRLITLVEEYGVNLEGQRMGVSHACCPEDAEWISKTLRERFKAREVIIGEIGAVIGTHVGPGTLALFFQGRKIGAV